MRNAILAVAVGAALFAAPRTAGAQAVSFSKDIVPILRENCAKCHNARQTTGGLSVVSYAGIEKGSKGGKILAAKPEESRLVKYLTGELKPQMPPTGPLKPEQIAKIKAWITQGAKADVDPNQVVITETAIPTVKVPKVPLKVPALPQAAALAWSKDNKILAIGTYKVVRLVDPATGQTIRELPGHADVIHSLQFSHSGKLLAAAGGPPAQQGEIKIWDVATGNLVRTITGHNDFIYCCSWNKDDSLIASASYDKLVKIWDANTGSEVKTLKDHADAVYAVAFSPDGNLLATGSADRSVKVWEVASGKRLYTLSGHTEIVLSVAWNEKGNQLTSVGADRTIRTWNVNAAAGQQARNSTGHEKSVNEVVYSPDGNMLATVSDDHSAKIWNAGNGSTVQTIKDQPEALLSAAFSGDNAQIAIGSFDGTVKIFNVKDGKLISTVIDLPKAPEPKPAAAKPEAKPAAAKPAVKPVEKK